MSIVGKVLGEAATPPIQAIGNVIDALFTSDEEKLDKQAVIARIAQAPALVQAEINKIEAAHRSIFVAGWRPFIGWVCGCGFLWAFIGQPLFEWAVKLNGLTIEPPNLLTDNLMEVVIAMLGMGTLRTFEKLHGRAK